MHQIGIWKGQSLQFACHKMCSSSGGYCVAQKSLMGNRGCNEFYIYIYNDNDDNNLTVVRKPDFSMNKYLLVFS